MGQAEFGKDFDDLNKEQQAQLQARLKKEIRTNTYNKETKEMTISKDRADAFRYLSAYYAGLFMDDPDLAELRNHYAIPKNTIKDQNADGRNELHSSFGVHGQPQQTVPEVISPIRITGQMKS